MFLVCFCLCVLFRVFSRGRRERMKQAMFNRGDIVIRDLYGYDDYKNKLCIYIVLSCDKKYSLVNLNTGRETFYNNIKQFEYMYILLSDRIKGKRSIQYKTQMHTNKKYGYKE